MTFWFLAFLPSEGFSEARRTGVGWLRRVSQRRKAGPTEGLRRAEWGVQRGEAPLENLFFVCNVTLLTLFMSGFGDLWV